jgi:hypothetical protein
MVATFPTQYPFPVAPGGLRHSNPTRPLRGPPAAFVRQPYLGDAPAVQLLTGFGAGSGAFIRNNGSDADQSQGLVVIRCGLAPGSSGNVALNFPIPPLDGQYWCAADWANIATPIAVGGNALVIPWTANRPLLPNEVLLLAYQWLVST